MDELLADIAESVISIVEDVDDTLRQADLDWYRIFEE